MEAIPVYIYFFLPCKILQNVQSRIDKVRASDDTIDYLTLNSSLLWRDDVRREIG